MNKKLGLKIREIRTKRGLTQYQLADMVVADVSTINKIEKNKANPSLSMLERIAQALGVSSHELLKEDDDATHAS
ncbi:helix-turn-helix family protein [Anoxybacillus sp. B7M1]|uniref:helix-turn-helix transcriptional regulator n=1 Tax=unclassified Anoxybacillus TaxID=2639704 RepID=UPI0005CD242D|nr:MULTISPECIES: helix-turn-helix transcriptional regulator [unclassified Anoxybacillus]ANB56249.1 helix-turn-helix family protein [Anoxybacillus sp. B2M1]ANB63863.1 helix-turn-helix family protein [Anoxybacillus sp. B7M1]